MVDSNTRSEGELVMIINVKVRQVGGRYYIGLPKSEVEFLGLKNEVVRVSVYRLQKGVINSGGQ